MSTVAALIVRPDGTAEIRDVENDLATMQGLVGGYLEAIHPHVPGFGAWHAYIDEEAGFKADALPNPAATEFALSVGWVAGALLKGPVVFLGSNDEGDETDVPPEVVGAAVRAWGLED